MPAADTDAVRRYRAQTAALTRDRDDDDPELIAARNSLFLAQRKAAYHSGINASEASLKGEPFATVVGHLKVRDVPIEMRLLGVVEILAYVVSLADHPGELIAALRARADVAQYSTTAPTE